jgi:hypothetical protein
VYVVSLYLCVVCVNALASAPLCVFVCVRMCISNWTFHRSCSYVKDNRVMVAHNRARNKLTERVLRLAHLLLNFGYYPTNDALRDLLTPLYDLLDPASDLAVERQSADDVARWQSGPRYQKSNENKAMYQVKLAGAVIVDSVLNHIFNQSLGRFLAQFKVVRRPTDREREREAQRHA